ncbi:tetraacyldisaccharide 4'-kinase [Parasediminibacterium sp. JCM 36343]|uniref:tetraacyldisaccharide 4'-kinase n=1 Tax=Parasediminibacterium sp. JCM 36343 TaxID=3374279 RepID=UPI00397D4EAD
MNFNNVFLKSFRVVLLPFALLYGLGVIIRNWLYDKKYFKSIPFNFPLICIGNIVMGGTGKSPMVEYLIDLLHPEYKIGTLSRGYKRKTKGYLLATEKTTALDIGDESMQFHNKYPNVAVAVGEERLVAIPQLLQDRLDLDTIIMDDAFQHRQVAAGLNIVLTEYSNLYVHDFFFPTGDLRDQRASMKRANIIVVTKCPTDLWKDNQEKIIRLIEPLPHQKIFFTTINYGIPYHIVHKTERTIKNTDEVLLVCGIASPKPLKEYLLKYAYTYYQKNFNDHHIFTIDDFNDIKERFERIETTEKFIITTEKDAVRLAKFTEEIEQLPIYVLPIKHKFLFNEGEAFNQLVISFINSFSKPQHHE